MTCSKGEVCCYPQEMVDEGRVLAVALRPLAVGDPGRLDDPLVPAEVVDETDEALVEDGELAIEQLFGGAHEAVGHGTSRIFPSI